MGASSGEGVEIVAELAGHLLGRCQAGQLLGGGSVASDLTLDALQAVSELPQRVSEGLRFLFGAAGLVPEPRALVRELSPPRGQVLGHLGCATTFFGSLLDRAAELFMPLFEAIAILGELAQRIGEPITLPLEISKPVAAGGQGRNRAQKILSLLGGLLLGLETPSVGLPVRRIGFGHSFQHRIESGLEDLSPMASLSDAAVQRSAARFQSCGLVPRVVE